MKYVSQTMHSVSGNMPDTQKVLAWGGGKINFRPHIICGVILLSISIAQAASHKHPKAPADSLLKECQGVNALPSPNCGRTPTPAFGKDGSLWLAFVQNSHVYVTHSNDLGQSFKPPMVVNRVPEVIYSDGENRPKIMLGPQGNIYVSWTQKSQGKYAGNIRFARSIDGAKSFEETLTVNDDLAPISHRFESMAVDSKGRIYITWIDKRDLAKAKKSKLKYTGAAIYYALSKDHGQSFSFNRKVADHSCQCCRIAMDVDSNDDVIAMWRHVYPVNIRDHAITRLRVDTPPISGMPVRATDDGWQVKGCPHHGPDLAVGKDNKAHMTWFTQGKKNSGLMYGRFDLTSQSLDVQHSIDASSTASRPQVAVAAGRVYTAWKIFNGEKTELRVRISDDDGLSWSAAHTLAQTADGSDFPVLITQGDKVFVSWHTRAEGYQLIPVTDSINEK